MKESKEAEVVEAAETTGNNLKNQIDGLNRRNTALEKERDELKAELAALHGSQSSAAVQLAEEAQRIDRAKEALKLLAAGELPLSALDLCVGEDFQRSKDKVETLARILKEQDKQIRNDILGTGARHPGSGRGFGNTGRGLTLAQFSRMTPEEVRAYTARHPGHYEELVKKAPKQPYSESEVS